MKKLLSLLLCAVMLLGFVPTFAIAADTTSPTASISAVSGTVRVKRGNSEKDISAFLGMKIKKDDTITTGAKGAVTVDIGDDKVIKASANSSFSVTSLTDKNGVAAVGFTLIYGTVYNAVSKAQSSDDNYTVKAGNTVMGVRGTKFTVSYFVDKDGVAKYRIVTIEGTVYTRTLEPKLMSDNNNILDIQEGAEIGLGQSAAPGTGVVEIPLEELDRSELELILEDENAPEELRDAVKEILDNLPPVKDEETPPPSKVVYEDEQSRPTPAGGSTSGQTSTPPPSSPSPSPAPGLSAGAQSLQDAISGWVQTTNLPILLSSIFPAGGGALVPGDDIVINISSLTTGKLELIFDVNMVIPAGASIKTVGSATSSGAGVTAGIGAGKTLDIGGNLTVGALYTDYGSTVINTSSNSINIVSGNSSIYSENYGTIENTATGKIVISGSGYSFNNWGRIENAGEISVEGGAHFTNIDDSGDSGLYGEYFGEGEFSKITIAAGATLDNGGSFQISDEAKINNDGTFTTSFNFGLARGAQYKTVSASVTEFAGGSVYVSNADSDASNGQTLLHVAGTTLVTGNTEMNISNVISDTGLVLVDFPGALNFGGSSSTLKFVIDTMHTEGIAKNEVILRCNWGSLANCLTNGSNIVFVNGISPEILTPLSTQVISNGSVFSTSGDSDYPSNPVKGLSNDSGENERVFNFTGTLFEYLP